MRSGLTALWVGVAVVLAVALVPVVKANDYSTAPYQEPFENYNEGDSITNPIVASGWTGSSEVLAIVTNVNYSANYAGGDYPITTNHSKVLYFRDGTITNTVTGPSGGIVWTDFAGYLNRADDTNLFKVDAAVQVAMFVSTNGHPWLRHIDNSVALQPIWTEFTNTTIASSAWVRLSVKCDFANYDNDLAYYFQVYLNGIALSSPNGFSTNTGSPSAGGTWFVNAYQSADTVSSFVMGGTGYLDDLVVTTNDVVFPPPALYTTNGTPMAWLAQYGYGTDDSIKGANGMYLWESYIAGLDPTQVDQVFAIVSQTVSGSGTTLKWLGGTNGPATPFTVKATTNLSDSAAWLTVDSNVPRDPSGTNTWTNSIADPQTYYRIVATNIYP